jgi:coenzyme PQQ precursor peptide PqqA
VTAVDRDDRVSLPDEQEWEPPTFEEIRVSAEVTAYMGALEDWD